MPSIRNVLQLNQDTSVSRQRCADFATSSADWSYHFKSDSWRTSSPLHPNLGFRYAQPARFQPHQGSRQQTVCDRKMPFWMSPGCHVDSRSPFIVSLICMRGGRGIVSRCLRFGTTAPSAWGEFCNETVTRAVLRSTHIRRTVALDGPPFPEFVLDHRGCSDPARTS
jgi:hypothetical protein